MHTVVSFYKFVKIEDPRTMRTELFNKLEALGLKGTILLASEGINGMLSGPEEQITAFEAFVRTYPEFKNLWFKVSEYQEDAFRRLLVKVKKEIVTFRQEGLIPQEDTGAYLEPLEFKKWLDEGKDMLIVDTRNDYEVNMGTFKNALDPNIKSFSQFAQWVQENLADQKDKEIVTFCTGGIRCEKATAYMKQQGFNKVYQIHGGILNYFEQTQGNEDYWQGECTVFDKRKAVDKKLNASQKVICYVCLTAIPEKNDVHPGPAGEVCKNCKDSLTLSHEKRAQRGLERQKEFRQRRAAFVEAQRKAHLS